MVKAHMRLARAFGIDEFICSWWGIGGFEDKAFARIVDIAEAEGFNVTTYYEPVRNITRDQIISELSYILERYSGKPAFLKVGGRPLIFIYAVEAYNRSPEFWGRCLLLYITERGLTRSI